MKTPEQETEERKRDTYKPLIYGIIAFILAFILITIIDAIKVLLINL